MQGPPDSLTIGGVVGGMASQQPLRRSRQRMVCYDDGSIDLFVNVARDFSHATMAAMRRQFILVSLILALCPALLALENKNALFISLVVGPILIVGWNDLLQRRHSVRRNFPVIGNFRYFFEA